MPICITPAWRAAPRPARRRVDHADQTIVCCGISEPTLYRYREKSLEGGQAARADGQHGEADPRDQRIEKLEKDLAKRDQVMGELTTANRIFNKKSEGLLQTTTRDAPALRLALAVADAGLAQARWGDWRCRPDTARR